MTQYTKEMGVHMRKIGFIGAQSMHTAYFGEVLAAGVHGLDSTSGRLWAPDKPKLVGMRLAQGELYGSCDSLGELLDCSDAVMVLLRDGNEHRKLAEACLKKGKPVFVDKPFACDPLDAKAMVDCAKDSGLPLMGGSTLCWLPETKRVAALAKDADEISISFAADWDSPYGGWYFYGSHLTDLCAAVAGCGAKDVRARRSGQDVEAVVEYTGLKVRLFSSPQLADLRFSVRYKNGKTDSWIIPDYERCYRLGMEKFSAMLRSGKSVHPERLAFSIQLLDHIVKSLSVDSDSPAEIAK